MTVRMAIIILLSRGTNTVSGTARKSTSMLSLDPLMIVDGKPVHLDAEYKEGECVWEYDVMGLVSVSR